MKITMIDREFNMNGILVYSPFKEIIFLVIYGCAVITFPN